MMTVIEFGGVRVLVSDAQIACERDANDVIGETWGQTLRGLR